MFKELPNGWTLVTINDVFDVIRGISFPKSARTEEAEEYVGCLRTANVQRMIEWDDLWKVPASYLPSEDKLVKENDIIISTANSLNLLGKSAMVTSVPVPSTFGTFVVNLRAKTDNPKYLYYYLQSRIFLEQVAKQASTTTNISNISTTKLKRLLVPIPSILEQNRIVARIEELFSELDNGAETLRKTKQQLAVYRKAVLKSAFTPGDNWRTATVSEIGEVNLGRQRSPKNVSNNYPTKYIRAANITENGLALDDILEMEFTPEERKKYYLRNGDIVISEASGSASQVGKPAIWRDEIPNCCFQNTVIRHRVTREHPEYIFWYYRYLYVCGYFSKIVGGVGINHLGAKNFSGVEVHLAPYEEQLQIVEGIESKLSICDSIEKTVDTALQQAEAMRQSILKQAFEGKQ